LNDSVTAGELAFMHDGQRRVPTRTVVNEVNGIICPVVDFT
jgi:hypothetical protein